MTNLETYHKQLSALYNYSRIPLWFFDVDGHATNHYFIETYQSYTQALKNHVLNLLTQESEDDFQVYYTAHDLFFRLRFVIGHQTYSCIGGPILLDDFHAKVVLSQLSFASVLSKESLQYTYQVLPIMSVATLKDALHLLLAILELDDQKMTHTLAMALEAYQDAVRRDYTNKHYDNLESVQFHSSYKEELAVLTCVKQGDTKRLEATFKAQPRIRYGQMSQNPLRLLFYGCIANTTLVTRYAIEGGMGEEAAFTLSDTYIRLMEQCKTVYELQVLNEEMGLAFTQGVAKANEEKRFTYSEPVRACIDYIQKNLHQKITLDNLAREVHLSPKYMSWLFIQETETCVTDYVLEQRIEEAKNLLAYTDFSLSHISHVLAFSSQSYFIQCFKKMTATTPGVYRKTKKGMNL